MAELVGKVINHLGGFNALREELTALSAAGRDCLLELLPPIPGHSHSIGADGTPTCGCTYQPKLKKGGA